MWKPEQRLAAGRNRLLYPIDLNAAWRAAANGQRAGGSQRDLLIALDKCEWIALPKDLPPKSTAHCYFMLRASAFIEK
jgi:hypothetical protein